MGQKSEKGRKESRTLKIKTGKSIDFVAKIGKSVFFRLTLKVETS